MTQTSEGRNLENIVGPLARTVPQFEISTIQDAPELTNARRTNEGLRDSWFYLANSAWYTLEDGEAIWYSGRGETNPFLYDTDEAIRQVLENRNCIRSREEVEAVKRSVETGETLKVKLTDLDLQNLNNEFSYFEIDTANPDSLNQGQRRVAEHVYGQGDDFRENMRMFNENGKNTTRVYVLNPNYVKDNVQQDSAIVRATRLSGFNSNSNFVAYEMNPQTPLTLRGLKN